MSAKCCAVLGGEEDESCELSNVVSSVVAVVLSTCAALMYWANKGSVADCLAGMGGGAASLVGMTNVSASIYTAIMLLNVTSMAAIWLSFFHCEKFENAFKHMLTSSRSLCWLRIICSVSFLVQIFRSGYAMAFHGAVCFLAFLCNRGPGVTYLAQELVYAIGNSSTPGGQLFVPATADGNGYGQHSAWSPFLDVGRAMAGMNLDDYCKDSGDEDSAADVVVVCVVMTIVSQALMVCALTGEKERVTVHELHEHHLVHSAESAGGHSGAAMGGDLGGELGHLLGGAPGAAAVEQLPLLAKQAAQNPSASAASAAALAAQAAPHMASAAAQGANAAYKQAQSPQGQQQMFGALSSVESMGTSALTGATSHLGPAGQTALHDLTSRFGAFGLGAGKAPPAGGVRTPVIGGGIPPASAPGRP